MRKLLPVVTVLCAVGLVAAPAGAGGERDRRDQRIAEAAVPTLSDFPDGWESERSDDLGQESGFDECRRIDRANQAALDQAYAETPRFSDPDDPEGRTTIEGAVFVFGKVKGAKRYLSAYERDSARDCLQAIGESQVEHFPSSEVGTSDLEVDAGDDAVGYRLEIEGTDPNGETDALVLDLVILRVGRAAVNLGAQASDEPPPLDDLVDTMLDHLEDDL